MNLSRHSLSLTESVPGWSMHPAERGKKKTTKRTNVTFMLLQEGRGHVGGVDSGRAERYQMMQGVSGCSPLVWLPSQLCPPSLY